MLTSDERDVLTRLFGPELPDDTPSDLLTGVSKSVEVADRHFVEAAINCLLTDIVATGLGDAPFGWSMRKVDGVYRLTVYGMPKLEAATV